MEAITINATPAGPAPEPDNEPSGIASEVDGWLAELELTPIERAERDEATSWDIVLDGRKRRALRITLILDPGWHWSLTCTWRRPLPTASARLQAALALERRAALRQVCCH